MRAALCLALALLAGCAETSSKLGWVDETLYGSRAAGPAQAAYAGVDRIKVYGEPDTRSPVQGVLTLHEQVTRYQRQSGFAYVEAAGNIRGWVREEQLVASRPQKAKPAPETPPAPPMPTAEPEAEPEPEPAPPPDEKPEDPEGSVFDPY
jgi:hypothetical protein